MSQEAEDNVVNKARKTEQGRRLAAQAANGQMQFRRRVIRPVRILAALSLLVAGLAAPALTRGGGAVAGATHPMSESATLSLAAALHPVAALQHGIQLAQTVPLTSTVGTTVPANGDINPYGVALVPRTVGKLVQGDVLVSNFNDKANEQGTGTTIVEITPSGTLQLFASITSTQLPDGCPGGVGLTVAVCISLMFEAFVAPKG